MKPTRPAMSAVLLPLVLLLATRPLVVSAFGVDRSSTTRPSQTRLLRAAAKPRASTKTQRKRNNINPNKKSDSISNDDDDVASSSSLTAIDDDDVQAILNQVSDAEALLACRAYLIKRRRWLDDPAGGWSEWTRRQAAQQQTAEEESTGFFWEDLSQLQYWNPLANPLRFQQGNNSAINNETTTNNNVTIMLEDKDFLSFGDYDNTDDQENDESEIARHSTDTDASSAVVGEEPVISLAAWHEAYLEGLEDDDTTDMSFSSSLEDTEPSPEYLRRSQARRKKFSDAAWKEYWYERRWGGNKNRPRRRPTEERMHHRLAALWQSSTHAQVLAPVANMTQDEMSQAIVEYVLANRKRSTSQLAWRQQQAETRQRQQSSVLQHMDMSATKKLPRDALLQVNKTALEEKQKARSERARKAYETRRQRQGLQAKKLASKSENPARGRSPTAKTTDSKLNNDSPSPSDALQRIEAALDKSQTPKLEWVELAMGPSRLKGRKEVLARILKDCFGLYGKQRLPIDPHSNNNGRDDGPNSIVLRSVGELGKSCTMLLRQKAKQGRDE